MAKNEMLDYGFNMIIREYAGFPYFLSLPCHWEHGWTALSLPANADLATDKKLMLVFSKRKEQAWKEKSNIPVVIMGAPFVHYRRMKNIQKDESAKGTVAFPSHSCEGVEAKFDIKRYCQKLHELSAEFKPVTICLHIDDISRAKGEIFKAQGFNVVTAGDQFSPDFPMKFYNILRFHNFATSNTVGSYTFYAVEMGVPFFILGDLNYWENYGNDPNVPKNYSIIDYPIGKYAYDMFNTGSTTKITEEQKNFVIDEVGLNNCLPSNIMKKLLLKYKIIETMHRVKRSPIFIIRKALNLGNKVPALLYLIKNGLIQENKIFTHMTTQEKIKLHQTLVHFFTEKKLVCVEIGSYLGASSCFIANAISKNSTLYCIDTWQNDAMKYENNDIDRDPRDTYEEFKKNTQKYFNKIKMIRKWSHDAISDIRQNIDYIDFLFIDGDHNYEAVKSDWEDYSSLLTVGSIVVFHDTGWAEGVKRIINEAVINKAMKIFELPNMQGYKIVS